jgi:hypothetical protein
MDASFDFRRQLAARLVAIAVVGAGLGGMASCSGAVKSEGGRHARREVQDGTGENRIGDMRGRAIGNERIGLHKALCVVGWDEGKPPSAVGAVRKWCVTG